MKDRFLASAERIKGPPEVILTIFYPNTSQKRATDSHPGEADPSRKLFFDVRNLLDLAALFAVVRYCSLKNATFLPSFK